jgi:hypothetical protein
LDISVLGARVRDSRSLNVTIGSAVADCPPPSLQAARDGCTHLVALLQVRAQALRARLGFENVAYRCTRIHPMKVYTSCLLPRTEELYRCSILGNRNPKRAVKPGKQRKSPAMAV